MAAPGEDTMKSIAWIAVTVIAATALAGCTQQPGGDGQAGSVTRVTINSVTPENVPANGQATVCWRVEGTGTIPHTAIHTDTESHPGNSASFSDYDGQAFYPDNATTAQQVTLPGNFCTAVTVGEQNMFIRAHAMAAAPGMVSAEREIQVRATTAVIAAVTLGQYNQTGMPGNTTLVCWTVTGTGHIPHTALHTDTVTRPTATSFADYKGSPYYPQNRTSQDPAGYDLPGTFCTNLSYPANGTLYFRAHAMTNPPGMMSAEGRITGNNTTAFTGTVATVTFEGTTPANAPKGEKVVACWRVAGTGNITETGIATDTTSHPAVTATLNDYDGTRYYPDNRTAPNATGYATSGAVYCTAVTMPATTGTILYLRPYAVDSVTGARMALTERQIAAL